MAIVDPDALKAYMSGIRLPPAAATAIPGILDGTQGELEAFLGYPIDLDLPPITELAYVVNRDGAVGTSVWPVAEVTAFKASDGTDATYTFTGNGDLFIPSSVDTYDPSGYTVTYRPGLPPRPLAVAKNLIMRVASREVAAMHDDTRLNDDDKNSRKAAQPAIGWQKGEKRSLSRWRSRAGAVYSRPQPWLPDVGSTAGSFSTIGTEIGGVVSIGTPGMAEGDAVYSEGY